MVDKSSIYLLLHYNSPVLVVMINAAQEDAPRPPGLHASDGRDAGALDGPRRSVVAAAREAGIRGLTCCSGLNIDTYMLSCSCRVAPMYGGTSTMPPSPPPPGTVSHSSDDAPAVGNTTTAREPQGVRHRRHGHRQLLRVAESVVVPASRSPRGLRRLRRLLHRVQAPHRRPVPPFVRGHQAECRRDEGG